MTQIHTTIRPVDLLDVDDAELESLTRQGLIVGVPATHRAGPPDMVVTYVSTTMDPDVIFGVGAAELESLTRQQVIAHNFGSIAHASAATAAGTAGAPIITHPAPARLAAAAGTAQNPTAGIAATAGVAAGVGSALDLTSGYGVGGYGTQPYGA